MQTMRDNKRAGLRLAILAAGSSLVIGSVVWLMISFWPRPNPSLPAEAALAERPVAAASEPVKAAVGTNPGSRVMPGSAGKVNGPVHPTIGTAGANVNRTPRPLVIPKLTETNQIRGPLPWRNGPPVRTPQPGAPAVNASNAPRPNAPVPPGAVSGSANGRALPFMPPARRAPPPTPSPGAKGE